MNDEESNKSFPKGTQSQKLMKLRQHLIISNGQIQILVIIWVAVLTVLGSSTFLSVTEREQNLLNTYRWRAETLAYKIMQDMMAQGVPTESFDLTSDDGLKKYSLALQQILEHYTQAAFVHVAIIDTRGFWVAHQKKALRNTSVENQQLLQFLETQDTSVFAENETYHILVPIVLKKTSSPLGMVDIGIGKAGITRELRRYAARNLGLFFIFSCGLSGLFLLVSRSSVQSLQFMTRASGMIADGDLMFPDLPDQGIGEIRQLAQMFRKMSGNLYAISLQVQQTMSLMATAVQDMLGASDRLAASLEEQSASIAQTSMNMESVVQASQQISKSTDTVVRIAEKTRADAEQGLQVAEETLHKMRDIQQSNQTDTENIQNLGQKSKEISKIMDVIVSIADQTKLIAFNASLEAAGAGKAGKRFGIVAKEIRTLADHVIGSISTIRKTSATIQDSIRTLSASSETSTENIQQGAEHTVRTTEWLQEILSGTIKTTRIAQRISRSLLKQQLASEEISTSLKELLQNTNEFARTGAITSEVAGRLDGLTKELETLLKNVNQ